MKSNPFNLTFGIKADNYIRRMKNFNEITSYFDHTQESGKAYIISGIRGSGKTAMLTEIQEYYENKDKWIVVELIPNEEMLEQLAAKLIDVTKSKKHSLYRDRLIKKGLLISKGYGKIELALPRFNETIKKYYLK